MKIRIIGTGTMGKPMAHHVLKAGHSLFIYVRHPEKVKDLEAAGASAGYPSKDISAMVNFLGSFVGLNFINPDAGPK